VADKAKLTAWRSKRGMSQADAMSAYITECDRQLKVYGTRDSTSGSSTPQRSPLRSPMHAQQQSNNRSPQRQAAANATTETTNTPGTPQNTPHYNNNNGSSSPNNNNNKNDQGVLLCPRGLAAIPLLCAAAAESRSAYLARLQVTAPSNGWWAKQEVLCLEPTNPLSIPEKLTIGTATQIERLSLVVSDYLGDGKAVSILSPRVMQAFLWPVHNIFLCVWICLILTTTYLGSMVMMVQTLLFGAKRTNAPLGRLFMEEVAPCARAVESLCEQHQGKRKSIVHNGHNPPFDLCILCSDCEISVNVYRQHTHLAVDWVDLCIWYGLAIPLPNTNHPTPSLLGYTCDHCVELTSDSPSYWSTSYGVMFNAIDDYM